MVLPDQLFIHIFGMLDGPALAAVARTCTLWRAAATYVALEGRIQLPSRLWILTEELLQMYVTRDVELDVVRVTPGNNPLATYALEKKAMGWSGPLDSLAEAENSRQMELDGSKLELRHPYTAVESGSSSTTDDEEHEEAEASGEAASAASTLSDSSVLSASRTGDACMSHSSLSTSSLSSASSSSSSEGWSPSWWKTDPPTRLALQGATLMDTAELLTLLEGVVASLASLEVLDLSRLNVYVADATGEAFGLSPEDRRPQRELTMHGGPLSMSATSLLSDEVAATRDYSMLNTYRLTEPAGVASLLPLVASLSSLTELNLTRCLGVTEVTLAVVLSNMSRLRVLRAATCLEVVGGFTLDGAATPELEILDVSHCYDLTFVSMRAPLTRLRELHMVATHVPEIDLLAMFKGMPRLEVVNLARVAGVSNKAVFAMAVAAGSRLRKLHLDGATSITTLACRHLASQCDGIRWLSLNACPLVEFTGVEEVFDGMPELETLDVGSCVGFVGDVAVMAPASLRTLNLSHCVNARFVTVSGRSLRKLLFRSNELSKKFSINLKTPVLEELDLTLAAPCTDARLLAIGGRCPNLRTLIISSTRFSSLGSFLFAYQKLRRLDINQCFQCSDESLWAVARWCEKLEVLSMWGLDQRISEITVAEVRQTLPELRIVRSAFD
ncbi:uncharacterized protein AMSG_01912 [Thecamonas trahens ATCC 50062]|uniref:F-box domain-containing protein n=1 Tax=Thecamonas trahens ATCC 50062 TaxID=461836 RepID=A0A0L0DVV1_THETB|nr:hypothetical protein AMSG_01912 [Thecamonas trahens ATCC 50062]KNC55643.1 hypothetical protein AMSG_01912 [Thecamonas trahens ATCC 50062]|eukprot:XP_013761413.1 hypothetical protein AMSG_01912 [Thecamonas trahens ATCC 50062]